MLPHGVQNDGYSCPMFTSNTLAHGVLDRPLLSADKAVAERLTWFIRLASQRRNGLAITDLLNPTSNQPRSYDSQINTPQAFFQTRHPNT